MKALQPIISVVASLMPLALSIIAADIAPKLLSYLFLRCRKAISASKNFEAGY